MCGLLEEGFIDGLEGLIDGTLVGEQSSGVLENEILVSNTLASGIFGTLRSNPTRL